MSENFNPKDFVKEIKTQQGMKPYLGAHEAIVWFRHEHPAPDSRIITVPDFEHNTVRADVYLGGDLVSTGHSRGDGKKSLEKLETGAIRRALANLGYGTISALASEYDGGSSMSEDSGARVAMASSTMSVEDAKDYLAPSGGKNRGSGKKPESKTDTRFVEVVSIERAKAKNGGLYCDINEGECSGFGQRDALIESGWVDDHELVNEGDKIAFEPPLPVIQADKKGKFWNMKAVINVPSVADDKELDIPM